MSRAASVVGLLAFTLTACAHVQPAEPAVVPGAPATMWVDTRTHALLRVRYDIAARATSFTDERVTPLPGEA